MGRGGPLKPTSLRRLDSCAPWVCATAATEMRLVGLRIIYLRRQTRLFMPLKSLVCRTTIDGQTDCCLRSDQSSCPRRPKIDGGLTQWNDLHESGVGYGGPFLVTLSFLELLGLIVTVAVVTTLLLAALVMFWPTGKREDDRQPPLEKDSDTFDAGLTLATLSVVSADTSSSCNSDSSGGGDSSGSSSCD